MNNNNKVKNIYISRQLEDGLLPYLDRPEIIAIKGPRQSGKTTLLKHLSDDILGQKKAVHLLTFEKRADLELFEQDIENFKNLYTQKYQVILIDEFQYAQDGGQKLKYLYDTTRTKFIITGSSSLELTGQTSKFLVGRLLSFELLPFSFSEFLRIKSSDLTAITDSISEQLENLLRFEDFNLPFQKPLKASALQDKFSSYLQEYLLYGGYPAVVLATDEGQKETLLQGILDTYLLRDIQSLLQLATDDELIRLSQFLALQVGNLIVYKNLSNAAGLNYNALKKHLNILQETYIIDLLRPYFTNKRKELSKNPMVYFLDNGLRNRLTNNFSPWEQRPDKGALLENFVYGALRRLAQRSANLKYWRTQTQAEVDFVLEKGQRLLPVEVKSGSGKQPVGKSLHSFLDRYKPQNALIITRDYWKIEQIKETRVHFIPAYYL